ncbi:MAG: ribonuclease HI family protein [Armatimonadetes bacterium]|nr:ribonuclease HI family protein [Armatimonadota bacterium]
MAYVDGASSGNPGPAGAGFVIAGPDGRILGEQAIPLGDATNNVAEYRALIAALAKAAALGARKVVVRSDSELIVKQMRGEYRVRNEALRPLHERAQEMVARFEDVVFEHVPREHNSRADKLARQAAQRSLAGARASTGKHTSS